MLTMQQLQAELEACQQLFTLARLLDEDAVRQMKIGRQLGEKDPCPMKNQPWRRHPCERCAVCQALEEKTKKTRLGFDDSRVYQITAKYLEVDGRPYVLELVQLLDDESLINPEDSEKLANKLLPYRDKLYLDPVTNRAFNRRYYEDVLKDAVIEAGVAVVDLDDFKLYNDIFGHRAGDLALETFTQIVQRNIRKSDMLIRYGGDEFVIVMPNVPEIVFQKKLQIICSQVHDALIPEFPNMQISVSIGGVIARGESVGRAMERADRLMYRAKNHKNIVVMEQETEQQEEVPRQKVLIVDDAELNRAILAEILGGDYEILEAENGRECIRLLQKYKTGISVILLDIVMNEMDGFGVLSEMASQEYLEDIPVIMISSADTDDIIRRAYEMGATDYISRPFDAKIVYRRVVNTINLYAKQRRLISLITDQIVEKEKNDNMMISILSHIVEFRNGESGLHVLHMRQLTEVILSELVRQTDRYHLDAAQRDRIVTASALHDIGKIAISEEILNKPGKLTAEEMEMMKNHTVIGAELLDRMENYRDEPLVRTAHDICRWHHERYDGRGYPDGLKGDQIPISAQIVALADVYDALVSKRVYKKSFGHAQAVQMILNGECGCFNPLLLSCLQAIADRLPDLKYGPSGERVITIGTGT